jgi:membrane fusion protein (multidrug efflux system)
MKKLLINLGVLALMFNISCESEHKEKHEEITFLVTSPIQKDTLIVDHYVCQIKSARHIEIRSQEKGYLQNIYVDEGQFVKKGELLFQIMPNLYDAEVQHVQAEAKIAEINYLNTKALADNNVVSANELALAKAEFDKAQAAVALAQTHLNFTQIRAPFDGITDLFEVKLGSLIDEGDLMTNLADNSEMWVYFNVPEAEYLNLKTKISKDNAIPIKLLMANNEFFDQIGELSTIEADFNNETGNIAFRATFKNPTGLLRHGETGSVQLTHPIKNAIMIPQKATFEVLDKKYVFVVDKDNVIKSRQITIGAELPHIFIVSEGLSVDDKILLEGLRKVKENEKIKYEFKDPFEVISNLELYSE